MAQGKTHSIFTTINYNSQNVTARIDSVGGIGVSYDTADVSTLASTLHEYVKGLGNADLELSGSFDNTATSGAHAVFSAAAAAQVGYPLVISIGIGAAPASGDPKLTLSLMMTTQYVVDAGVSDAVKWKASLRPAVGCTATWGTV